VRRVIVTSHAASKMASRGVTLTEVEECALNPEVAYGQGSNEIRQRGSLALAVVTDGRDIIVRTVLLRQVSQWTDEDARARKEANR